MDIDRLNELIDGIAERAKEKQKKPMDLEAVIRMYEEDSRKIRH